MQHRLRSWLPPVALACITACSCCLRASAQTPPAGGVWYVKPGGAGARTGVSWADAFAHPQTAVDAAAPDDEVWVAEGTYRRRYDGLDVVLGNGNWGTSRVWLNDGTGHFIDSAQALSTPSLVSGALGDVDGDDLRFWGGATPSAEARIRGAAASTWKRRSR